ncbi:Haemagluttinin repeat-containing protein, partial [Variovorax sp. CF079]|uniref:hemagglutinin repeat-containing protein n=1 Tax=Variovorax sp. CF079 TaxID=1882774 RepID=UPI00087FB27C
DIGGNLNIESLQDITNYASQQSSGGVNVSLCIPPICFGEYVSATVDYSKQKVAPPEYQQLDRAGKSLR